MPSKCYLKAVLISYRIAHRQSDPCPTSSLAWHAASWFALLRTADKVLVSLRQHSPATATLLQGLSSTTGLQTLLQLSNPLVTPSLINTNPGLALLLAANSQGSAALRGGWGDSSLPMDMPACTAAYLRHAALASSMAPYGNPGMHTEEAAMAHHYMTASELASQYMANDTFPNYLSATGFVGPRLAPQPWLDLADGLYQPSVPLPPHISSNLHVENALSEAVISGNHLCFGPQRHGHARDVRHARHSPY